MATQLMPPQSSQSPSSRSARRGSEPTVREVIAAARAVTARNPARGAWLLSGASAVLFWASFMPLDWGPLAWIALVPLLLLVRIEQPTRWMYRAVYAGGLGAMVALLQWMRLGDPTMYIAWIALAMYMAVYFPLFVALSRMAVHRFSFPLALAAPAVWTGLEYIRAHLGTGFAWYNLGHTQYRWIELIQISDLVGAYGVSFVVMMSAACLAGLVPVSVFRRLKLEPLARSTDFQFVHEDSVLKKNSDGLEIRPTEDSDGLTIRPTDTGWRQTIGVIVCLAVFGSVLAYGSIRRGQAEFREGPRVALIQGNFTTSLKHDPNQAQEIFNTHHRLTGLAVNPHRPDVIVWPETMYRAPLFLADPELSDEDLRRTAPFVEPDVWRSGEVAQALANMSQQAGAAMVIGIDTLQAHEDGMRHYNSAAFVRPDLGLTERYDKLHRVVFGEYVPLRETFPWLHRFTPFPENWGISRGEGAVAFEHGKWRFAPIICFEDTVPHLVRNIVRATSDTPDGRRPVDCLVNLTNDGWFHGSSELDQHLITSVFRSVETRTPMVRAVNTGISAVIDGDGRVVEPEVFIDGDNQGRTSIRDPQTGRWHKQLNAVLVHPVPLDNRDSLYLRWGDWFAATCCFAALFFGFAGLLPRVHP